MELANDLKERLNDAVIFMEHLRKAGDFVEIVFDGGIDGAAAAAIIARVLVALKIPFVIRHLTQVDVERLGTPLILVEVGVLKRISSKLKEIEALIIDHHLHAEDLTRKGVVLVNPYFLGMDGSIEACCSSISMLLSRELGIEDKIIPLLTCLGVEGDNQVLSRTPAIFGVNLEVLKPYLDRGVLRVRNKLKLFATSRLSLHRSLTYTFKPLLPGLTGREEAVKTFLSELGLNTEFEHIQEGGAEPRLAPELLQALIKRAISSGIDLAEVEVLFGPTFEYCETTPPLNVYDESTVMDLCVSSGNYGLPLSGYVKGELRTCLDHHLEEALTHVKSLCEELNRLKPLDEGAVKVFRVKDLPSGLTIHVARALRSMYPENVVMVIQSLNSEVKVSICVGRRLKWDLESSKSLIKYIGDLGGVGWGLRDEVEALSPTDKLRDLVERVGALINHEG